MCTVFYYGDVVYNSRGDLFFTDPPYGLKKGFNDPGMELDFAGVFKLSAEEAKVNGWFPDGFEIKKQLINHFRNHMPGFLLN